MKFEPVKICCLFTKTFNRLTGKVIRQSDFYYQVRSHSLGTCGHKHKTESAAEPCRYSMKRKWSEMRSQKSRRAHGGCTEVKDGEK